jgi:hypothetical protein
LNFVSFSESNLHGCPIDRDQSILTLDSNPLVPKCNTVCFMKSESRLCRNTICVSDKNICYSVKGNLLRVIRTATGEKLLLRGHDSPIVDLKFSATDGNVFCSVDVGITSQHVFVWMISDVGEFSSNILATLPLCASLVQSHPKSSKLWAISDRNEFSIFSSHVSNEVTKYSDLSMYLCFPEDVAGL